MLHRCDVQKIVYLQQLAENYVDQQLIKRKITIPTDNISTILTSCWQLFFFIKIRPCATTNTYWLEQIAAHHYFLANNHKIATQTKKIKKDRMRWTHNIIIVELEPKPADFFNCQKLKNHHEFYNQRYCYIQSVHEVPTGVRFDCPSRHHRIFDSSPLRDYILQL